MTTSPDRIEEYLKLYDEVKNYQKVGEVFGLSGDAIRTALKRADKFEAKPQTSPDRIEEYLRLYREEKKSYQQIGEVFGLEAESIRNALKRVGKLESRSVGSRKTSPERIEEYLTLYRQNKTYEQVGKVFGLSGKTIRAVIKSSGRLESRAIGRSKTSEETINQYLDLLSKGKTYREVGEIFWLDEGSIRSALKNAGKFESKLKRHRKV